VLLGQEAVAMFALALLDIPDVDTGTAINQCFGPHETQRRGSNCNADVDVSEFASCVRARMSGPLCAFCCSC
jgi:hypothetical protein